MLDIRKILQRSWQILWNYRTLWIFGFILALAIGGNNFGSNSGYRIQQRANQPAVQCPNSRGLGGTARQYLRSEAE